MLDWFTSRLRSRGLSPAPATAPATPVVPLAPLGPLALYQADRVAEAGAAASQRLAAEPGNPEALQVQALLALDRGHPKAALPLLQQLVQAAPDAADGWVLLGRCHAAGGRKAAAQSAWEQASKLQPRSPALLAELALAALGTGQWQKADQLLGAVAGKGKRLAQAFAGVADGARVAQPALAEQRYRAAIAADEGHADAHATLGAMLRDQRRSAEAVALLERALALAPGLSHAAFNLAMLRIDARDWAGAGPLLDTYLATQPKDADAHYWRANTWMGLGQAAKARAAYATAVRCNPQYVQARWGLAMAQLPAVAMGPAEQGEALANFGRELGSLQNWARTHAGAAVPGVGAQQPFYLAYIEDNHRALLEKYGGLCTALLAGWARQVGVPAPAPAKAGAGKLRVGIVSAHIHSHSVWHALLRGWLEHLDPARFELHVFHTGATTDAETAWAGRHARLRQALGDWTAWAKEVSDARLDALIYPEIGMDATALRLASVRLARVQLAGWGHPLTTGLPTIDGYLSAEAFEPPNAQEHYSEQLIALPRLGCAYQPYRTVPQAVDLARWGVQPGDRLLLCPGVPFKYLPQHDAVLVEIARRCQPCKLLFFRDAGGHAGLLEQRLRAAFAGAGVDFEASVRFVPWQSQAGFFWLLQRAEVFLDTIGFSGFNTAMQAVECGAPIVAWEGGFMRGRFASAILRQLGLEAWVAGTPQEYVDKVVRLCSDKDARADLVKQIRTRSPGLHGDRDSVVALGAQLQRLCAADRAAR